MKHYRALKDAMERGRKLVVRSKKLTMHRKRQLRAEVAVFAGEVLELTADSCESAAASVASDEEDDFARECLKEYARSMRTLVPR